MDEYRARLDALDDLDVIADGGEIALYRSQRRALRDGTED